MSKQDLYRVGLVAIGRNEGERLRGCLSSVQGRLSHIVYVDSGSTDGSVQVAQALGVHVINLDMSIPFTAARARNVGWNALLDRFPNLEFVQFIDGDCELIDGWLDEACTFLINNSNYAVVSGRLLERYPEVSIYNQLCDLEWAAEPGDAKACGGIAMMRLAALSDAGGFNAELIAGEEPELCLRLNRAGWKIRRIASKMAYHDAAIFHFRQWWKRSQRGGYAFAEGAWMHGAAPERYKVRETQRVLFWGLCYPAFVLLLGALYHPLCWLLLLAYPAQIFRLSKGPGRWLQAFFWVICKFAEAQGVLKFYKSLLLNRRQKIIEYK